MQHPNPSSTAIVFEGNILEVGFIKTVLEDAGIFCAVQDEIMGTIMPWYVTGGGVGAVKLIVSSEDATKATAMIQTFKDDPSNYPSADAQHP